MGNEREQSPAEPCPGTIELSNFDFDLPPDRIAQLPAVARDASKLLVLDRTAQAGIGIEHAGFGDFPGFFEAGDLLIVNATRVRSARLRGRRDTGGAVEALLLAPLPSPSPARVGDESGASLPEDRLFFRALLKLSGRLRPGIQMIFGGDHSPRRAEIAEVAKRGEVVLAFEPGDSPYALGEPPLPPYIRRPATGKALEEQNEPAAHDALRELDSERYQTIYARVPGAIAAPTAGLHFTEAIFERLEARGVERREVVLHVGPGTFRPLDEEALASGRLHTESYEMPEDTARAINETRARGGRVVAVGTTSARVLEACARLTPDPTHFVPRKGETDIFLRPGSTFKVVDALLTNFHLPRSSLLLLVAAFAGRERILSAYREAIENEYRFFSYGDAMLIL